MDKIDKQINELLDDKKHLYLILTFVVLYIFLLIFLFNITFKDEDINKAYQVQLSKEKVKVIISYLPKYCKMTKGTYVGFIYEEKEYKSRPGFFLPCRISVGDTVEVYHNKKYSEIFVQVGKQNYYYHFMNGYILIIMLSIGLVILIIHFINGIPNWS